MFLGTLDGFYPLPLSELPTLGKFALDGFGPFPNPGNFTSAPPHACVLAERRVSSGVRVVDLSGEENRCKSKFPKFRNPYFFLGGHCREYKGLLPFFSR